MSKKPFLSVVIPAYNESHNIKAGVLKKVDEYLRSENYTYEVIIVDDGSTDKTALLVEKFIKNKKKFRLMREPHRGKAGTVIAGMLKAEGDIILFTDADQSTPISQLEKVLPAFEKGFDIVIGSRSGRKGAPLSRKVMAFGFAVLRSLILRLPFRDTQAGFKAFRRSTAHDLFSRMKKIYGSRVSKGASLTAGFDIEFLYIARKLGYKIKEVPVDWKYEEGASGKSAIKNSLDGLLGILKIRWYSLTGRYQL